MADWQWLAGSIQLGLVPNHKHSLPHVGVNMNIHFCQYLGTDGPMAYGKIRSN